MKWPLVLSATLHAAFLTCAIVAGVRVGDSAVRPTVRWLPSEALPPLPEDPPEDTVLIEEPALPDPILEDPVLFTEEQVVFEEPDENVLPPLEPELRQDADLWRKVALIRVVPRRPLTTVEACKKRTETKTKTTTPFVPPSPLGEQNEPPRYPRLARRRGEQGKVTLNALVGLDGCVRRVTVLKSSGYPLLDEEAERAISKWVFSPATRGGAPIEAWFPVPVLFQLRE